MTYHPELERIARGIKALNAVWTPHEAQIAIGKALLVDRKKDVFAQCGRNFGKTELVAYLLWRWAWTFPGSENYYFSPFMKQSREILWATRRLQTLGPTEWINKVNEQEMRIYFNNGSFIKLDGSDNVDAYRGVKPQGLTVFDEFKDFRPEFFEAYDPNRAAFNSPLFIIGTPPEFEGQFTQVAASWEKQKDKAFFKFSTYSNPYISREWLANKKQELYNRGDGDKWEREYMADFVRGGSKRIFPMLKDSIMHNYAELMQRIDRDKRRLEWFVICDPAGASTFAVLFGAINIYSKDVYLFDEIYEQTQSEMTVINIGERIRKITKRLFQGEWRYIYDEAETWFANEMLQHFDIAFEPTNKAANDKTSGLSLIKDVMLKNKLQVSSNCQKWFWEADNYQKDNAGKIVKKNDHLLDCTRYLLAAAHYDLNLVEEDKREKSEDWRGARIFDDFVGFDETGHHNDEWEGDLW